MSRESQRSPSRSSNASLSTGCSENGLGEPTATAEARVSTLVTVATDLPVVHTGKSNRRFKDMERPYPHGEEHQRELECPVVM